METGQAIIRGAAWRNRIARLLKNEAHGRSIRCLSTCREYDVITVPLSIGPKFAYLQDVDTVAGLSG